MATVLREPLFSNKPRVAVNVLGYVSAGLALYFLAAPEIPIFGEAYYQVKPITKPNGFTSNNLLTNTLGAVAPVPQIGESFTKQLPPFKQNGFARGNLLLNTLGPVAPVPRVLSAIPDRNIKRVNLNSSFAQDSTDYYNTVVAFPAILTAIPNKTFRLVQLNTSFVQDSTNYYIEPEAFPAIGYSIGQRLDKKINNSGIAVNLLTTTLADVPVVPPIPPPTPTYTANSGTVEENYVLDYGRIKLGKNFFDHNKQFERLIAVKKPAKVQTKAKFNYIIVESSGLITGTSMMMADAGISYPKDVAITGQLMRHAPQKTSYAMLNVSPKKAMEKLQGMQNVDIYIYPKGVKKNEIK